MIFTEHAVMRGKPQDAGAQALTGGIEIHTPKVNPSQPDMFEMMEHLIRQSAGLEGVHEPIVVQNVCPSPKISRLEL